MCEIATIKKKNLLSVQAYIGSGRRGWSDQGKCDQGKLKARFVTEPPRSLLLPLFITREYSSHSSQEARQRRLLIVRNWRDLMSV